MGRRTRCTTGGPISSRGSIPRTERTTAMCKPVLKGIGTRTTELTLGSTSYIQVATIVTYSTVGVGVGSRPIGYTSQRTEKTLGTAKAQVRLVSTLTTVDAITRDVVKILAPST